MENKNLWEFLKIKLDFLKPFLTTLLLLDAGLIGFIFLNFDKNGFILNFCSTIAIFFNNFRNIFLFHFNISHNFIYI